MRPLQLQSGPFHSDLRFTRHPVAIGGLCPVRHAGVVVRRLLCLSLALCAACASPAPPPVADAGPIGTEPAAAPVGDPHTGALGRDPDALPEPIRQALKDFRDRFACNNISGCASERVLLQAGWTVRPMLQQVFEKAPDQSPYRARAVRVIAELQDPGAVPFLRERLDDKDPETRAYAIYGLGLLRDPQVLRALRSVARDDPSAWMAPVRLTALWLMWREGDPQALRDFQHQMGALARQQMAMSGLVWGLTLSLRPDGPDLAPVLPLVARHPNFQVRRLVARAMSVKPQPSFAASLVAMAADTASSIREPAERGLQVLAEQVSPPQGSWSAWCEATQCAKAADAAILALDTSPTAR